MTCHCLVRFTKPNQTNVRKIFLFLVLTTASSLLTAQNIPSYVPTDSLVGWWPFNGNANDESGNGNNGNVYGATLTSDRNGVSNAAYDYNGSYDHIQYGNYLLNSPSEYTISAWVKFDNATQYSYVFSQATNGEIQVACSNGNVISWNKLTSGGSTSIGTTIPDTTQWHHIVAVFNDNNNTLDFYLDQTRFSTSFSSNLAAFNGPALTGRQSNVNANFFNGKIDDLGIWNRALDSIEVYNLYNICLDTIRTNPVSNTFLTVPGVAYFTTEHSDTNATYQWQQNDGTGWTNLSDFGIYSGTTTDSLVLTGITSSMNGYGYRCIIDACSMDTTDVAFLTVENNIGLEEINESIVVSPNPTSGALSINLTSAAEYTLYNVAGQVVAQGKTNGILDITPLPAGSYQLVLTSEGRTSKHSVQKL